MSLRWSSWCAQTGVFDETWRRHRVLRRRGTNQKSGRMYTDEAGQRWATSEATWKPCFLFSRAEVCALARSLLDGGPERAELREVSRLFTQRVEKCWRERRGLEPVVLSTRRSATLSHRHSKARPGLDNGFFFGPSPSAFGRPRRQSTHSKICIYNVDLHQSYLPIP